MDTSPPDAAEDVSADVSGDVSGDARDDVARDVGEDTAGGPFIVVGTGLSEFITVENGDELEMVMGPQGGWHIDVSVQIRGLVPEDLELEINGFDEETGEQVAIRVERILSPRRVLEDGEGHVRLGDLLVFMILSEDEIVGRSVRVEARCTQPDGLSAEDSMVVVIADDEA